MMSRADGSILPRVLGTLSVEGQDVKGAKVGGGQERLSEYASFLSDLNTLLTEGSARHKSWNHQVRGPGWWWSRVTL